jgi:hypothetical protein
MAPISCGHIRRNSHKASHCLIAYVRANFPAPATKIKIENTNKNAPTKNQSAEDEKFMVSINKKFALIIHPYIEKSSLIFSLYSHGREGLAFLAKMAKQCIILGTCFQVSYGDEKR